MRFPKEFPDKLRSSILTSEVVGKKVKLKSRGKEFQGLCPFHNEKTSSFTVNDQKGFYHCFGCQAHGDIITFIMKTDGVEFAEAVKKLADDFGIPIPQVNFNQVKEDSIKRDFLILEEITKFFENNLYGNNGIEAREYLKKRNLNSNIAKKFRLGFALNSFEALVNFLKSKNFTDLEISKTGVIGQNDRGKVYDKFRNRVIFPINNKKGQVIAFGGRTIADEMPKYLNSAETDLFKKNQTLYNFDKARNPIFSKGYAVVVEGYMDVISMSAHGIENVVAGLGTALGAEHFKELFHVTDKIIICLDGDAAGIRAAKRASEIALPLITSKKNVFFTFLPNKMDPDDFIKSFGSKKMEELFAQASPLSESLFEFALADLGIDKKNKISAEDKAKIEGNLFAKTATIADPASKKHFSLFFKDLLFTFGRNFKKNTQNSVFPTKLYAKPTNLSDLAAKNIISFIIKNPELAHFRDDIFDIKETQLSSEHYTHLKEQIIEIIDENSDYDAKKILETLEKSCSNDDIVGITNIVNGLKGSDSNTNLLKFRILLLKDLLIQVDQQYKESLNKIDEIKTHQTELCDQKIREIFDYKNSLEQMIITLEKQTT